MREADPFAPVAGSQRRRRVALIAVGIAAVLVAVLLVQSLFSDDRREVEILDAQPTGSSTLVLTISACNADSNKVDVVERAEEVVLTVTTDDPVGGDDCADGVTVDLREPLADRRIVDGTTRAAVELSR